MEQALAEHSADLTLAIGLYATVGLYGRRSFTSNHPRRTERGIDARGGTSHMFALLNNGKKSIT